MSQAIRDSYKTLQTMHDDLKKATPVYSVAETERLAKDVYKRECAEKASFEKRVKGRYQVGLSWTLVSLLLCVADHWVGVGRWSGKRSVCWLSLSVRSCQTALLCWRARLIPA